MRRAGLGFMCALAACDSGGDEPVLVDPLVEIRAASAEGARALCEIGDRCERDAGWQLLWGDVDTCAARRAPQVERDYFAMGSLVTAEALRACAQEFAALACEDVYRLNAGSYLPDACAPLFVGALSDESACRLGGQCASGNCRLLGPCGECSSATFLPFAAVSEACGDGVAVCDYDAFCLDGTCEARLEEGEACDPNPAAPEGGCFVYPKGLHCGKQSLRCAPRTVAELGAPCGDLEDGGFADCAYGLKCRLDTLTPLFAGSCQHAVEDGEACAGDWVGGPAGPCRAPAECFQGACTLIDPIACSTDGVLP